MKVTQFFRMVGGAGHTSYASNSKLQEKAIFMAKPMVEESIGEIYEALLPQKMVVADLGCSSGPNTLLFVSEVLAVVDELCRPMGCAPPEIQFFLNDLPCNDFNNIFRYLDGFEQEVTEKVGAAAAPHFVVGVPGSFYGRLFPSESVHFFHSSYCLMWSSQVPEGLSAKSNKKNIYISETSPPHVVKTYKDQFQRDLSLFLRMRYAELTVGGRMVLTFLGRRKDFPTHGELSHLWGLLAEALADMAAQGIIEEEKLEALNLPFYAASIEEVNQVIRSEALFEVVQARVIESDWDPFDDRESDDRISAGKNVADCIRAVIEPTITWQFGLVGVGDDDNRAALLLDDLFTRYAEKVSRHLLKERTRHPEFVIALKRT